MKLHDSLVPYMLMTLHPLMHITLLLTGAIMVTTNNDKFY